MYSVRLAVHCDTCGQRLATFDGLSYKHENAADCEKGEEVVSLPAISVEQFSSLLTQPSETKSTSAPKPAKTAKGKK